jgi:hypothetical protein
MKFLLIPILALSMTSCAYMDDGRFDKWAEVMKEKEVTKQMAIDAEIEKAKAEQSAEIVIDSKDEMEAYAQMKQMETMGKIVASLAEAIKNLTGKDDGNIPMPKGAGAEGIDSATGLVGSIVTSPMAVAGVVGYTVGKYSQGSEVSINGDENVITDVGNDKSNRQYQAGQQTGDNNAGGTTPVVEEEEEELAEGWACEGCSSESLLEGKCSCD